MHKQSSSKKTPHLKTGSNQKKAASNDSADELPQQLHAWCLKMNLMPPHELPSVDELAKLCRGNARPALSYIIRHYQPRNRIAAFRAAQAAKAQRAEEEALLAEKSRLEKCLQEKNAEVKQWKEEVQNLESQLKDTNREKRELDRKTEAYDEQTRLLTMKASEIHMRLKSNKLTSEYLKSLGSTPAQKDAPNFTDERKVALVTLLKAAGNDEKALKNPLNGVNGAQLHDSLLHAQKQLLRKTEGLTVEPNSSAETRPSVLEDELLRIQTVIVKTEISNRVGVERNVQLQCKLDDLKQECIDALVVGGPDKLVDVNPSEADAQRFVEALEQREVLATWNAKLATLEAEVEANPPPVATPVGAAMILAQSEMHALGAKVYESLSELAATDAGIEVSRTQALAAMVDSSLPGDVAEARSLVDGANEFITSLPVAEESADKPSLQERVIKAKQLFAEHRNAQSYSSFLDSVSLPTVKPLDESVVANAQAVETAATARLDEQLAKLDEEIAATAVETAAACEAASHLEHPLRLLVPRDAKVGGKCYQEWQELCKAAVEK